ncbi:MAG: right-handed parallel beta-helix repeat-containing protein, partial [Kiritimatiellia bacterium]
MRYLIHAAGWIAFAIASCPAGALGDDHYAARNGQTPSHPYTTWESAAFHIQDAVNAAATNDTVWVGAGRYTVPPNATNYVGTNVVFINRPMTLRSSNGIPATTVIDGGGYSRGIAVFHKTYTTNRVIIDGLTVSNCYATNMGGGILFNADNLARWTGVVQNCVISYNTVAWGTNGGSFRDTVGARGGGIAGYDWNLHDFGLIITNCLIRGNTATSAVTTASAYSQGGGIWFAGFAQFDISDCLIESNTAVSGGGAYIAWPATRMDRCIIRENRSGSSVYNGEDGGGLLLSQIGTGGGGPSWVRNCLIYNNVARGGGGVHLNNAPPLEFYNCTIVSNRQTVDGGAGIWLTRTSQGAGFRAYNCVIYSNSHDLIFESYTNSFFTNCCVKITNNTPLLGTGNITSLPPSFANFAAQNFLPANNSPLVNGGFNQAWMTNGVD